MAKRKFNAKGAARKAGNAARRIGKKGMQNINFKQILMANAGGFGAAFLVDKLDDMEALQDKPLAPPLIVEAGAIVLSMFGGEQFRDLASGMMGGAAAQAYAPVMEMIEKPTNGTSTINATKERAQRIAANVMQRMAKGGPGQFQMGNRNRAKYVTGRQTDKSDHMRYGNKRGDTSWLNSFAFAGMDC